jgi:hypothetical protein
MAVNGSVKTRSERIMYEHIGKKKKKMSLLCGIRERFYWLICDVCDDDDSLSHLVTVTENIALGYCGYLLVLSKPIIINNTVISFKSVQ